MELVEVGGCGVKLAGFYDGAAPVARDFRGLPLWVNEYIEYTKKNTYNLILIGEIIYFYQTPDTNHNQYLYQYNRNDLPSAQPVDLSSMNTTMQVEAPPLTSKSTNLQICSQLLNGSCKWIK